MHIHEELYRKLEEWLRNYGTRETTEIIKDLHLSDDYVLNYCRDYCDLDPKVILLYRQIRADFV